jgi:hypothetical protein
MKRYIILLHNTLMKILSGEPIGALGNHPGPSTMDHMAHVPSRHFQSSQT